MQHYALALRDAESAISHGPAAWHKGHYRKAMAEFETKNFADAVQSFSAAAQRAPDETIRNDALAFVSRAQAGADSQEASERYRPLVGAVVGVAIGLLLLCRSLQWQRRPRHEQGVTQCSRRHNRKHGNGTLHECRRRCAGLRQRTRLEHVEQLEAL